MEERLQKLISAAGLMSRRAAETAIGAGEVTVNGKVAALGDKADPTRDDIRVRGRRLPTNGEKIYLMLNKPRGYVCTLSDEKGRKTVTELVRDVGARLYPVGRLDMDSEGLLLMTNDGDFANRLMHPSHEVEKCYRVTVSGDGLETAAERLSLPMVLDGQRLRSANVRLLKQEENRAVLDITIHEGRNRQVRRMCESVGLKVHRLCRISEGPLVLGKLPSGQWRYLNREELAAFERAVKV